MTQQLLTSDPGGEVAHQVYRNTTDDSILGLIDMSNRDVIRENSNKAAQIASTQRDLIAGEVSKDITTRLLLPPEIADAHDQGIIHFHDRDYFLQKEHNCSLIDIEDMLTNGTVINGTGIDTPKSFMTACTIITQIMAIVASGQYGGQTISLAHLAPYVDVSRKKIRRDVTEEFEEIGKPLINHDIEKIVQKRLLKEIKNGIQTIQYQILTISSCNGQTPFCSLFMYLSEVPEGQLREDLALIIAEVLKQRYKGIKNEKGVYVTPAFPKLLYVTEELNIRPDSKYYYLTKMAAMCTAKRMVPDYISEKIMKENKIDKNGDGQCYPCMGCRSFLTPYVDPETGKPKYYGRFNQGVVTVNLPDVGLTAKQIWEDMGPEVGSIQDLYDIFWRVLDERLDLCHKALRLRHERLLGTPSDFSPIHWQYGGLARLEKGEPIDKLLYGGYSTLSLGYAGLHECVKAITNRSHMDERTISFALEIMQKMNDACAKWKAKENIDYSLYGSPIESTTYRFAKCLKKRFGVIEGITDHDYITNSYHYHVTEKVDAFTKLTNEAKFQKLSPGGCISYVEIPNMENNIEAILEVITHIHETIMYAELNTKSDYCMVCGYDHEISLVPDEDGKLVWKCPHCGNTDISKMNIARRTCGYIGTQDWNDGRKEEIHDRVLHL